MKKILSLLLVFIMLVTAVTLSACRNNTGAGTSSEEASSEESVTPPTKMELLEDALTGFESYFTAVSNAVGVDLGESETKSGSFEFALSLDQLDVMGESAIGDSPLKIVLDEQLNETMTKVVAELHAAGDIVKFDFYKNGDKQYMLFPDLYGDTPFLMENTEEDDSEENELPDLATITTALEDFAVTIKNAADAEEIMTIEETENGKIFTLAYDKEQTARILGGVKTFYEAIGLGELLSEAETDLSDLYDTFTYVLKTEGEAISLTETFEKDGATAAEFKLAASVGTDSKLIEMNITVETETVLDLDITVTDSKVSVKSTANIGTVKIDSSVDIIKESDSKATISGSVSVVMDADGVLVTIPVTVAGSIGMNGKTVEAGIALSASISGAMDIALSGSLNYTPEEVTITLPFDEADAQSKDSVDLDSRFEEVYPNAYEFFGSDASNDPVGDDFISIPYYNEDYTLYAIEYSDATVEIGASGCGYTLTDDTLTVTYGKYTLLSASYTKDSEGNFEFFGVTSLTDYNAEAGCDASIWLSDDDGITYMAITLWQDDTADIAICCYGGFADGTLELTAPDGTVLSYDCEKTDDTVSIFGDTLTLYVEDSMDF